MTNNKHSSRVKTIDCNFLYPEYTCAYLLIEGEKAAFIENNTQFAVPGLISALKEHRLKRENVEYIIITHVHLDHAGGTSALAKECPNATVLAQKRAARHIIDPEKLIKGSTGVYGKEKFERLYGDIGPVDENRVRIVEDGESIKFGSSNFQFIYTPGHAKHHMCIYDSASNGIFTGDSFGLLYPALQTGNSPFIFPSTSPSDFDPGEARKSINKIIDSGAETVFLTHFGPFEKIDKGAESMIESIDKIENILRSALDQKLEEAKLDKFCQDAMTEYFKNEITARGISLSPAAEKIVNMESALNAQGVAFAVQKQLQESAS